MNPRNDIVILQQQGDDENAFAELAQSHGMSMAEFTKHWNAGARRADAEWALQPHERGVGETNDRTETGPGSFGTLVADHYGAYKQKGRG